MLLFCLFGKDLILSGFGETLNVKGTYGYEIS